MYILIILLIILMAKNALSRYLAIIQYENITLKSCGLPAYFTPIIPPLPPHPSCFTWHKTIIQRKFESSMSNIKGGRFAKPGEYPYTVLILAYSEESLVIPVQKCTGVIINELWVLTAAHCLDGMKVKWLRIYIGITDYPTRKSFFYKADTFIKHKDYDLDDNIGQLYDIALIKLKLKIKFGKDLKANSVCLPASGFGIDKPELAVYSGWGYVSDNLENTQKLKRTLIKITRKYNHGLMIITDDVSLGVICDGDSGGPLVQYVNGRAVVIGICNSTGNKMGKKCGPINRIEFCSVRYHMKWIYDTINNN